MCQVVSDEKVKVGIERGKNKVSNLLPLSGDTRGIATPLHELIHKVPYIEKADQILKPTNKSPKSGHGQNQGIVGPLLHKWPGKLNQWKRDKNIAGGTISKCLLQQ
jgi:hypothetical protein